MKKLIGAVVLIMSFGVVFCFLNLRNGAVPSINSPVQSSPKLQAPSDILTDIRKAQRILEQREAGFQISERNKKGKWEVKDFNILLAIQNAQKSIEVVTLNPETKQTDREYAVNWTRSNGVNTDFSVSQPQGCTVLGIRRVIRDEGEFKEVVYTPYTSEIDCELLRNAGLMYLKKVIEMARVQLRSIKSQSNPEVSVVQSVSADLALVLAIIEHIDPARLGAEPIDQLINEVLVIVGANQGNAYRYSVSKAGARGLFQFMPRTYTKIVAEYPEARLNKNFVEGMNDHLNAAKASLLLFDSDRKSLKDQKIEAGNKHLASAYNCGATRTAKEVKNHKGFWENKVPKETRLYLKKFSAVWYSLIGA